MLCDSVQKHFQLALRGTVGEGVQVVLQPLGGQSRFSHSLAAKLGELPVDVGREERVLPQTELAEFLETFQLSPLLQLHQLYHASYFLRELVLCRDD